MRTIALQVERSSQEQSRGSKQIKQSMESINSMVGQLTASHRTLDRGSGRALAASTQIEEAARRQENVLRDLQSLIGKNPGAPDAVSARLGPALARRGARRLFDARFGGERACGRRGSARLRQRGRVFGRGAGAARQRDRAAADVPQDRAGSRRLRAADAGRQRAARAPRSQLSRTVPRGRGRGDDDRAIRGSAQKPGAGRRSSAGSRSLARTAHGDDRAERRRAERRRAEAGSAAEAHRPADADGRSHPDERGRGGAHIRAAKHDAFACRIVACARCGGLRWRHPHARAALRSRGAPDRHPVRLRRGRLLVSALLETDGSGRGVEVSGFRGAFAAVWLPVELVEARLGGSVYRLSGTGVGASAIARTGPGPAA